ncbi:TRM32-like protein (DUF3741) [Wolffia australiana]
MKDHLKNVDSQARSARAGVIPGCLWGMIVPLDSYQNLRHRKMLGEKRSASSRLEGGMCPPGMIVESVKEDDRLDSSKTKSNKINLQARDGAGSGGNASDRSWITRLNPIEIYKKHSIFDPKNQKQRLYPSTRSFSRTISIHHLECDDYVSYSETRPEEISVQGSSPEAPSPFSLDSCSALTVQTTHIENALNTTERTNRCFSDQNQPKIEGHQLKENDTFCREKPGEAKKKLLKRQTSDPDSTFKEDTWPEIQLNKSRSYPPPGSSVRFGTYLKFMDETSSMDGQLRNQRAKSNHDRKNMKGSMHDISVNSLKSAHVSSFNHANSQGDSNRVGHPFKELKSRIKDVLRENQKQKERISWDSILHKIPYGSTTSQKKPVEKPSFSEVMNTNRNTTRGNLIGRVRRSQSLTETMEQYAQLLEANSRREPIIKGSGTLSLVNEEDGFREKKPIKSMERISSLPEIKLSYFGENEQKEVACTVLHSPSMSFDQTQSTETIDIHESAFAGDVDRTAIDSIKDESAGASVMNSFSEMGGLNTDVKRGSTSDVNFSVFDYTHSFEFSFGEGESGMEMKSGRTASKNATSDNNGDNSSCIAVEVDRSGEDERKIQGTRFEFDYIRGQVDMKHEAEFLQLVDVLKSYLSSSVDLSELNLEGELEGLSGSCQSSLDEDLLNDLTHETLLETLENTVRLFSTEPMIHVALRILRQAWANISWHLGFQRESGDTVEYIIDRDFGKNDGWMELGLEVEGAVIDMGTVLLDDLMKEALMDFLG